MRDALRDIIGDKDPKSVDLTEGYKTARASVFAQIDPIEVTVVNGQSVLLHRHMLHGVAPWKATDSAPDEGRMVAYFRPEYPETDRKVKHRLTFLSLKISPPEASNLLERVIQAGAAKCLDSFKPWPW